MQQEKYISGATVVAWTLWTAVASLMIGAWAIALTNPENASWAYALALTAGAVAPVAAVAHLRIYTQKVCHLIRMTAGLAPPVEERSGLRSIH